jgi:hypothetical protein
VWRANKVRYDIQGPAPTAGNGDKRAHGHSGFANPFDPWLKDVDEKEIGI